MAVRAQLLTFYGFLLPHYFLRRFINRLRELCNELCLGSLRRRGLGSRLKLQLDRFFHSNLASQKSALFGHKCGCDYISPDPPGGADFQFLGGDVAAYRACDDDGVGAYVLAGNAPRLADDQHASQGDLAFECAFNADAARAVDASMPNHARAEYRGDAFHSLNRLRGVSRGCVAFAHIKVILP